MSEVADPAAQPRGLLRQRAAEHDRRPGAGPQKARQHPQQGGLARAVRTEHGEAPPALEPQARAPPARGARRSRGAAPRARSRAFRRPPGRRIAARLDRSRLLGPRWHRGESSGPERCSLGHRPHPLHSHRRASLAGPVCHGRLRGGRPSGARAVADPRGIAAPSPSPTASSTGFEQVEQGLLDAGSVSLGTPQRGALVRGVQLPPEGADFFTWDFPLKQAPNRPWRRWAAGRTIAIVLAVIAEYRAAHPGVPRVGIADLSRPHGGDFGKRFGGLGHASHQNGLDVDILYPRRDLKELIPSKVTQIDRRWRRTWSIASSPPAPGTFSSAPTPSSPAPARSSRSWSSTTTTCTSASSLAEAGEPGRPESTGLTYSFRQ